MVAKRLARDPACLPFGPAQGIGVINEAGALIAGVIYSNYDPDFRTIELSFAADTPKWLSRPIICELLGYAFDTLNVNRLNAFTPKKNGPARKFIDKFGFRREGVATDGFGPGEDAIISRLLKREWLLTKWARPVG